MNFPLKLCQVNQKKKIYIISKSQSYNYKRKSFLKLYKEPLRPQTTKASVNSIPNFPYSKAIKEDVIVELDQFSCVSYKAPLQNLFIDTLSSWPYGYRDMRETASQSSSICYPTCFIIYGISLSQGRQYWICELKSILCCCARHCGLNLL